MHKDHYENLYAVIQGEKHFTLMPPEVYPYLMWGKFQDGKWEYDMEKGEFVMQKKDSFTTWIGCNVDKKQDNLKFEQLQDLPKYHVKVEKEEMLYLPALWYFL